MPIYWCWLNYFKNVNEQLSYVKITKQKLNLNKLYISKSNVKC